MLRTEYFEAEPEDLVAGIKIKHVSKVPYLWGRGPQGHGAETILWALFLLDSYGCPLTGSPGHQPSLRLCPQGPVWRLRVESATCAAPLNL